MCILNGVGTVVGKVMKGALHSTAVKTVAKGVLKGATILTTRVG